MASLAMARASSRVSASVTTSGRSGTETVKPPSAWGVRMTSYSCWSVIVRPYAPGRSTLSQGLPERLPLLIGHVLHGESALGRQRHGAAQPLLRVEHEEVGLSGLLNDRHGSQCMHPVRAVPQSLPTVRRLTSRRCRGAKR